jgi:hypothetical protein
VSLSVAKFFVRVKAPYLLVPRGGRKVAARIAKDFVSLIDGFTERYNELNGTQFDPAQGLTALLGSNLDPSALFSQYREIAEVSRGALSSWSLQPGFDEGWKWLTPDFADWFVSTILPRSCKIDNFHNYAGAPLLTKVLVEHPKGKVWMRGFVEELRRFLYPDAPMDNTDAGGSQ